MYFSIIYIWTLYNYNMAIKSKYFQDHMHGNICFGCGNFNNEGLQIKSYWDGDQTICKWHSDEKYQGWKNILNGGVLASVIDCHTMATASAHAYKLEGRTYGSKPDYKYATGTLTVKYLKPTPNDKEIELRAKVTEQRGKVSTIVCDVYADGIKTAEANVIAIRVVDSSVENDSVFT